MFLAPIVKNLSDFFYLKINLYQLLALNLFFSLLIYQFSAKLKYVNWEGEHTCD